MHLFLFLIKGLVKLKAHLESLLGAFVTINYFRDGFLSMCYNYQIIVLEVWTHLLNFATAIIYSQRDFLAVPKSSELPKDKQGIVTYVSSNLSQGWKDGG